MPVTKTAKRALRVSKRKQSLNKDRMSAVEIAIRKAKKTKTEKAVSAAYSLVDKAAKKKIIHKNKAARIKSQLSKLVKPSKKIASKTKTSSKKKS